MTQSVGFKQFSGSQSIGITSVHAPISPADIYAGDPIVARIKGSAESDKFSNWLPLYRLSPLGGEIDVTDVLDNDFSIGSEFDVTVKIGNQICEFNGIAVASIVKENNKKLVGFRWYHPILNETRTAERRGGVRWFCGEQFLPNGVAPNPARFNDFIYFTVVDISNAGMQLSTSLRNKFLIPGMVLEAGVSFPMIGQLTLKLKIINARLRSENGKEYLSLGTQFDEQRTEALETIGQYLMQFGPRLSADDLRRAGLAVRSTESAVNFFFVKTAEDYRQILALRKLAYAKAGKADEASPPDAMSDIYDSKSRILSANHNGEAVGSLRVTFHSPDEKNEYDELIDLPDTLPRRDQLVVLSRICTHPSYRGSDLFYGMMRQCILTVLQSRRRYILGGCTDELLPLYQKVGFKPQNIYYQHKNLKGVREQIIVADVLGILSGIDVSPTIWNELYSDLTSYISHLFDVPFDPSMNFRIALYRSISPLTKLLTKGIRKPKRRSH